MTQRMGGSQGGRGAGEEGGLSDACDKIDKLQDIRTIRNRANIYETVMVVTFENCESLYFTPET